MSALLSDNQKGRLFKSNQKNDFAFRMCLLVLVFSSRVMGQNFWNTTKKNVVTLVSPSALTLLEPN
jgi:hypothetical protein